MEVEWKVKFRKLLDIEIVSHEICSVGTEIVISPVIDLRKRWSLIVIFLRTLLFWLNNTGGGEISTLVRERNESSLCPDAPMNSGYRIPVSKGSSKMKLLHPEEHAYAFFFFFFNMKFGEKEFFAQRSLSFSFQKFKKPVN